MVKRIRNYLRFLSGELRQIRIELDQSRLNQGIILAKLNESLNSTNLNDYEFRTYSQSGEDGIIQYLTRSIPIRNKTFIEFGASDFLESNCRFLQAKDNWEGFVIDSSLVNIQSIQSSTAPWRHHLDSRCAYITRENINDLLAESGFATDLGILSIDIDGNDYHVFDAITEFRARILIIEYNSTFGPDRKITIPYRADFERSKAHFSNLYFGASLGALNHLAQSRGYALVGTNSSGVNAFFIRKDLLTEKVRELSVQEAFRTSTFRDSLDETGRFDYLKSELRLSRLSGMSVLNVESGELEAL